MGAGEEVSVSRLRRVFPEAIVDVSCSVSTNTCVCVSRVNSWSLQTDDIRTPFVPDQNVDTTGSSSQCVCGGNTERFLTWHQLWWKRSICRISSLSGCRRCGSLSSSESATDLCTVHPLVGIGVGNALFHVTSRRSCDFLFQCHTGRLALAYLSVYNASCSCLKSQ